MHDSLLAMFGFSNLGNLVIRFGLFGVLRLPERVVAPRWLSGCLDRLRSVGSFFGAFLRKQHRRVTGVDAASAIICGRKQKTSFKVDDKPKNSGQRQQQTRKKSRGLGEKSGSSTLGLPWPPKHIHTHTPSPNLQKWPLKVRASVK